MSRNTRTTAPALTGEAAAHLVARQALELVAHHVQTWDKARSRDDLGFDDADVDCDFAIQLVGLEVNRLRADPPPLADFDWAWYRMAAPVHLALKSYSKPKDTFGTLLSGLAEQMKRLPSLWEIVGNDYLQAPMPGTQANGSGGTHD